ncbi:MAG: radical SAM protein [Proteobacteria bacterium]|nr:radical SAM protein [Pseudomonadota bacterium]
MMTLSNLDLRELDHDPKHGLIMKGWNFSQAEVADALVKGKILNPAVELFSNVCPWNCDFCFTESSFSTKKRKLRNELPLERRKELLRDLAQLGTKSINIVGAGEPTIDPDFFELLEYATSLGITPIVYTEGSLRLSDVGFCKRLYEVGATVVLKVNSLWNESYQNQILVSGESTRKTPRYNYFKARQTAIENMFSVGFNQDAPTRMAFDTIICRENFDEIEPLHRYARDHNIFILLVNYLPSGRSASGHTNSISRAEQFSMFARLAKIDRDEYGITQRGIFPYAGSQPCLIRGTGLFVKINGDVLACPGETRPVGSITSSSLAEVWDRLRDVRASFDGGCPPRERFWAALKARHDASYQHDEIRDDMDAR